MPYSISDADMANAVTQSGYVLTALTNLENAHPSIQLTALHKQLNAMALIAANAIYDNSTGQPVASNTFGGNGNLSGTTPQSGGTNKGP